MTQWFHFGEYTSEETWITNLKEYMHPYVHCSIIYNSQDLEAAQVFISQWVDKKNCGIFYTIKYYSSIKKKEILLFVTAWMDLESIMLSEIRWSEKEK